MASENEMPRFLITMARLQAQLAESLAKKMVNLLKERDLLKTELDKLRASSHEDFPAEIQRSPTPPSSIHRASYRHSRSPTAPVTDMTELEHMVRRLMMEQSESSGRPSVMEVLTLERSETLAEEEVEYSPAHRRNVTGSGSWRPLAHREREKNQVKARNSSVVRLPSKQSYEKSNDEIVSESSGTSLASQAKAVRPKFDGTRGGMQRWVRHHLTPPPSFDPKPMGNGKLYKAVHSSTFAAVASVLICVNALYIGIYAEQTLQNELARVRLEPHGESQWVLPWIFDMLFFAEVLLRLCSDGWGFLAGKHLLWNVYDLIVLLILFGNIVVRRHRADVQQACFLRIFRMGRLIQLSEIFRLPVFSHLRMITNAMAQTLTVLFWFTAIGALCIYAAGVAFVLGFARIVQVIDRIEALPVEITNLTDYFSSVHGSMLSLYMGLTGGIDWIILYKSLSALNIWYKSGYLCFNVFMLFVVFNVVTGMVIDRAFKVVRQDRDYWILETSYQRSNYEERVTGLFHHMDLDTSGTVTWDEFSDVLNNPHVEAFLSFIELDTANLYDIFCLLDKDRNDSIEIEEFLDGVYELKGVANKVQIRQLQQDMVGAVRELKRMMQDQRKKPKPPRRSASSATGVKIRGLERGLLR